MVMGWGDLAAREATNFEAQMTSAVQTADAFRCESDSDEGSATIPLSQRSSPSCAHEDGYGLSLWWSDLLKDAASNHAASPECQKRDGAPIKLISACTGCFAEGFVLKARPFL